MVALPSVIVHVDDSRVRIAVTGEDRFTWLNGVLTCDLEPAIDDEGSTPRAFYGCALNVKGRVLGDVIVVAARGKLGAWVPRKASSPILELWKKYVIMEDCELALDEGRALVVVQGKAAQAPDADAGSLDLYGLGGGFVCDVDRSQAQSMVDRCVAAGSTPIDDGVAMKMKIEHARASWGFDLDEHAYVQEGGLEERAVSFNKGCYLGQEVVCMLQMRGKVHRRLVQLAVEGKADVGVEVKLGGEVVGTVTSVAPHDDGTATALAMLKSIATPGVEVDVGGAKGRVIVEAR